MTRIAICNPSIETGDAVSNDMVGMKGVLQDLGHEVSLFAQDSKIPELRVWPIEKIRDFSGNGSDILIYHYATGWETGIKLLKEINCRKVIKFHNVTPPEFFRGINEDYAVVCRAGRQQLFDLARIDADLYLSCSDYSRQDLIAAGVHKNKCQVVPPFHQIDRLRTIDADLNTLRRYKDGAINILMVGRLAPNKNHEALIESFHVYHRGYNANSRLFIVGGEDPKLRTYTLHLRNRVRDLDLEERVIFAGKASDTVLKAHYLISHAFMMTSKHEGFCVPLVEAMSMKIPIVAYGSTAVPETVGKVGLVWDECDPDLMAASVHKIVGEESLGITLGERGWTRYVNYFSNSKIKTIFLESLKGLL